MSNATLFDPPAAAAIEAERPDLSVVDASAADMPSAELVVEAEERHEDVRHPPPSDYPTPKSLVDETEFVWDQTKPVADNAMAVGVALYKSGDLFRSSAYAGGLMLASSVQSIPPTPITTGKQLAAIIADRLRVRVIREGKSKGNTIPTGQLNTLLASEVFLRQFRPIDQVVQAPLYLLDFELAQPGYNGGERGYRIFYAGEKAAIKGDTTAMTRFLEVMPFARTNTVAAALTVLLRNHFAGGKPVIAVTSNKSHAGKDTCVLFTAGRSRITSVSFQSTDWALERAVVGCLKLNPTTAVINIENARLGVRDKFIHSAFVERFVCDPEPTLFSTGSGGPVRRKNDLVVAVTTNFGSLSTDLLNRALPIHLELVGDIADRESPIGNPKLQYLPEHADEIEAELRGLVEAWKKAGCPRDENVVHPFAEWAAVVGGILMVSGFKDFLGNWSIRRTADDPLRRGLGLLGAAQPDVWSPATAWAELSVNLGLYRRIIPSIEQDSDEARARGLGVVLSAHDQEDFHVETEAERMTFRLEKARRRFEGRPSTRYRFCVIHREALPAEEDHEAHT